MNQAATESPDVFRTSPGRGVGVRRISRAPLAIIAVAAFLVLGAIYWTILERSEDHQRKATANKRADPATSVGLFDGAPNAGLIAARSAPTSTVSPVEEEPGPLLLEAARLPPGGTRPADADDYAQEWQMYRQQQGQIRQAQLQAAMAALAASPAVGDFERTANTVAGNRGALPQLPTAPAMPNADGIIDRVAAIAQQAGGGAGAADQNNAAGKQAWLDSDANPANYLPTGRQPVVSPYELKTGTVIPGVMIGGINSDLPGQIIAQVRESVWDTATGRHLLIPQGARLVGTYDNQVTRGQSRVLVAWTRLIYPDGSSVDLGKMPGADQGGYAGLRDKVNNHYWRVFGDAMLMSLFSAGIQLSQPDSNNESGGYSSQQIIAASIGQQLGQTGMQITQRNMSIQPTLEIRPGYRFNVMVTRDMILRPWTAS